MNSEYFNIITIIISIISISIATYSCHQNYKINKEALQPYVYLYLVSTKKGTYVKIKNFGRKIAILKNFSTNVDLDSYKLDSGNPFPFVGLTNITLAPNSSKIALINNDYLNNDNWIKVEYIDTENRKYEFRLELNTYGIYAIVIEDDFDIIDY